MAENIMKETDTVKFVQEMIKNSEKCIDDKGAYKCGELYEAEVKEENRMPAAIFFDEKTYNYHLFPYDKENLSGSVDRMKKIAEEVEKVRDEVIKQLNTSDRVCVNKEKFEQSREDDEDDKIFVSADIKEDNNDKKVQYGSGANGDIRKLGKTFYKEANHLYRYIAARKKGVLYELNFMRFFINTEKKVNCILKAIQFDRALYKTVNCGKDGKFDIAYPTSYESQSKEKLKKLQQIKRKDKSFCYNPAVSFYYNSEDKEGTVDNAKLIAEAFIDFIDACDPKTTYIAHKSILSPVCSNQYYLKLNRAAQSLEVYEQADNNTLRELYPLREDFDTSDYVLFTLKKHVSGLHEEYVSPYHPQHEQVKFFGYLAVFEDYFIHSNMYLKDATSGTFQAKEPVSEQDAHTSGCIRVPQEELDWLVANIPEKSIIEM